MNHLEDKEQAALFKWAAYFPVLRWMFAVPNGGYRNKPEAARLKRQGVKAGVSDICLPIPMNPYHGLFIEMKRSDGKGALTDNQKAFQSHMELQGYKCVVCEGFEAAIKVIKEYAKI